MEHLNGTQWVKKKSNLGNQRLYMCAWARRCGLIYNVVGYRPYNVVGYTYQTTTYLQSQWVKKKSNLGNQRLYMCAWARRCGLIYNVVGYRPYNVVGYTYD